MEVLHGICLAVTIILMVLSAPLMGWVVLSVIPAYFKKDPFKKKRMKVCERKDIIHRFAIIICARNEEEVIGNLIDSLNEQDYPKDKYKVFVIADNCTDSTAEVATKHGAIAKSRNNNKEVGKGYALTYGINWITTEYKGEFDAVCVFDADNLVGKDFLKEANEKYCTGAHVVLGYRDTKNIHDSWVSESYAIYWWMMMRLYNLARYRWGLSGMVGGTGFTFLISALKDGKWQTKSLTEDIEFSIQQICMKHRIVPARKAIFYDEQPVSFSVSVKQRARWLTGGIQCIPLYIKQAIGLIREGNKQVWDVLWYLFFMVWAGLNLVMIVAMIGTVLLNPILQPYAPQLIIFGFVLNYATLLFVAGSAVVLEKKGIKNMLRGLLTYPIFIMSMMVIATGVLIRPSKTWVPIKHNSSVTIAQRESE